MRNEHNNTERYRPDGDVRCPRRQRRYHSLRRLSGALSHPARGTGACDRYANEDGRLIRTDALVLAARHATEGGEMVPFLANEPDWDGNPVTGKDVFVTAPPIPTTTAPFIVSSDYDGVDTVTVVTEGIFSYCGVKVKIDTDRHIGPETAAVRVDGEHVGHVTTAEYGSQMLSLGGVNHLTGGTKKEGNVTCRAMMALCNKEAVEVTIDDGSALVVQAGKAPIIDGIEEQRMRVGCALPPSAYSPNGSAKPMKFRSRRSHHRRPFRTSAGGLGMPPSGIKMSGRRSTPGRYFQVAEPGSGQRHDIKDPLAIIEGFDPEVAWPGMRLLMTSDGRGCDLLRSR